MIHSFEKLDSINGELEFSGDKSISHRAVIFSALAKGESIIKNCSDGEDVKSTIQCFKQLGCDYEFSTNEIIVKSNGYRNFIPPATALNAGNSGTTSRLLSGILMHQKFQTTIVGDESLSTRPMKRVIEPLTRMGANISAKDGNYLPLTFFPSEKIAPIKFQMDVASAQVKSAVLLSGLHIDEETVVFEKKSTRDHTERMLSLPVLEKGNHKEIISSEKFMPEANEYFVPSDLSTAAFFIVAALLHKNSELIIKNVSLNPTRTAFIKVLQEMGAKIFILNENISSNEPYGDLLIQSSGLNTIKISENVIPLIIDEIPILSIAGLFAHGVFEIGNAAELRVKESDRIASIVKNLLLLGIDVEEYEDGFSFRGKQKLSNSKILFESYRDHRIAMSFAILSTLLEAGAKINNFECVNISNPNFLNQLLKVCK